jgi:hypothetical protein
MGDGEISVAYDPKGIKFNSEGQRPGTACVKAPT